MLSILWMGCQMPNLLAVLIGGNDLDSLGLRIEFQNFDLLHIKKLVTPQESDLRVQAPGVVWQLTTLSSRNAFVPAIHLLEAVWPFNTVNARDWCLRS